MAFPHPRGGRAAQVRPLRVVLVLAIDRRPESAGFGASLYLHGFRVPGLRSARRAAGGFPAGGFCRILPAGSRRHPLRPSTPRSSLRSASSAVWQRRVRSRGLRPRFRYRPPKEVVFVVCEGIIFPCRRRCVPQCRRCRPGGRRPPLFRRRNSLFRLLPVRCRRF